MKKIIVFILLSCLFFSDVMANPKRLFVGDMQVENKSIQHKKKWENLLLIAILREYKDYLVMSDDTVVSILKQGKLSQEIQGKAEFLDYLSNSLQFEDLIEAEVFSDKNTLIIALKWLQLGKESRHFQTQNQVQLLLDLDNPEFSINEAVRSLYLKTPSVAKWTPQTKWTVDSLDWKWDSAGFPKIVVEQGGDIPISLVEGIYTYLAQGDSAFKARNFEKARDIYLKLRNSISQLSEKTSNKVKNLTTEIENRIQEANLGYYQLKINELDQKYKPSVNGSQSDWEKYKKVYLEEWDIYKKLPKYAYHSKIDHILINRIGLGYREVWKFREAIAMQYFQRLDFLEAENEFYEMNLEGQRGYKFGLGESTSRFFDRKELVKASAISYFENAMRVNLLLAESENSRAVLERSMGEKNSAAERKYNAVQIMNKTRDIYQKNQKYIRKENQTQFNHVAKIINTDSDENKIFHWRTVLQFPVDYAYNIARGVGDIFVFKWGLGLGAGGEALIAGATPGLAGRPYGEISTGYGTHIYSRTDHPSLVGSPISSTTEYYDNSKGKAEYMGLYGMGVINCGHIGIRLCGENKGFATKKYSNINLTLGAIGLVQVNIEAHAIVELPLVVLGMNPDLLNVKDRRKRKRTLFTFGNIDSLD